MFLLLLCLAPSQVNAQAVPVGIAVGGDNLTRLLWNNPDGSLSLWKIAADGSVATQNSYGPYTGWSGKSLAAGTDGVSRILWTNTDGTAALWRVDAGGGFTHNEYGPYSGWTGLNTAVGGDNISRILWGNTSGQMALWSVSADGSFTHMEYGPYTGYTAFRVAAGPNSIPRTLWNKNDGSISLWYSAADAANFAHSEYGPFAGYTPAALAVDSTNAPRIVWNHPSDKTVDLWKVAGDNSVTAQTFPDPAGYSPVALAAGTVGDVRLLWGNGQGGAVVWTIAAGGTYTSQTYPIVSAPARLVSIVANPNTVSAGNSSTITVNLSSAAPVGGATVYLSSDTGSIPVPYAITVPVGASSANFSINTNRSAAYTKATITATYAGTPVSTSITVTQSIFTSPPPPTGASPDYRIFANPVNADVTESASGSVNTAVTITVSPVNSYNGNVYLYLPTLPDGVTASLSSPVVPTTSGDASSDLIFTVASTTRPGDYTINLQSISSYDNSSRYTPISLTVEPAVQNTNFTIAEDTDALELEAGSSGQVMLTLTPDPGFNSTVSLSLEGDPNKPTNLNASGSVVGVFSTSSLSLATQTSTLTFQVGSQVPEGAYHLLIRGRAFTGTQTLVLTIFVLANTDNATLTPFPSPPTYPGTGASESSTADMSRYDLNGYPNSQTSSAQMQTVSGPYNSVSSTSEADFDYLRPKFLGKSDDRIYMKPTYYPYSAICRIVVYFGNTYANIGSGVLIGKNHVLTAAHILYDGPNVFAKRIAVYPGYDNGISPK